MIEHNPKISERLKAITQLPTLPVIAQKVMAAIDREDVSAGDIVAIIEQDPSITAKLLGLANSAFFGGSHPISRLEQAVVRLGTSNTNNLVMAVSFMTMDSGSPPPGSLLKFDRVFAHSAATAIVCREFCEKLSLPLLDESFLAGMVHDIGFLLFITCMAKEYDRVAQLATDRASLLAGEKLVFGFTHPELGAWLADKWHLPEYAVAAARFHHEPNEAGEFQEIAGVTALANVATTNRFFKIFDSFTDDVPSQSLLSIFKMSMEDFQALTEDIDPELFTGEIFHD